MKRILFIILPFLVFSAFTRPLAESYIQIRIFSNVSVQSVQLLPASGDYRVYGDSVLLFEADKITFLQVMLLGDSLVVQKPGYSAKFRSVQLIRIGEEGSFKIKPVQPDYKMRFYDDHLVMTPFGKTIRFINKTNIESYVAGVVQWEVGIKNPQEFNKVKTIVCRTYALGNRRRHEDEGFQLCDEVHCQVFKGKTYNSNILEAARATEEYVLVDDSVRVITAAFHSNCGGQTMNSEDVWSKAVSCLRSVNDTFCIRKTNASWEKKIPKDLWLDYVHTKYSYPVNDSLQVRRIIDFQQPHRLSYLMNNDYFIPLKFIREDMKLKSTYFSIQEEGENLVFKGRGFGHGVGLCQEGAMRMAELGYSYTRIINYYYTDVHLIRFSQLDFFKPE